LRNRPLPFAGACVVSNALGLFRVVAASVVAAVALGYAGRLSPQAARKTSTVPPPLRDRERSRDRSSRRAAVFDSLERCRSPTVARRVSEVTARGDDTVSSRFGMRCAALEAARMPSVSRLASTAVGSLLTPHAAIRSPAGRARRAVQRLRSDRLGR